MNYSLALRLNGSLIVTKGRENVGLANLFRPDEQSYGHKKGACNAAAPYPFTVDHALPVAKFTVAGAGG
jgi:hypothetical protein